MLYLTFPFLMYPKDFDWDHVEDDTTEIENLFLSTSPVVIDMLIFVFDKCLYCR